MDSQVALIISVFTPFQLLVSQEVVASEFPTAQVYLVDQRAAKFREYSPPQFENLQKVCVLNNNGSIRSKADREAIREALNFSEMVLEREQNVIFLCASLEWALNNALFTLCRRRSSAKIRMFEDGISTYIPLSPGPVQRLKRVYRLLQSYLPSSPRLSYVRGAHAIGLNDPDVEAIYVKNESVVTYPLDRLKKYSGASLTPVVRDLETGIFLIQHFTTEYGEQYSQFVGDFIASLAQFGVKKWFVKLHHFSPPEEAKIFMDAGFELFDSRCTVEEALLTSPIGVVASINTTALVTVKLLFEDGIRSISISPDVFAPKWEKRGQSNLVSLFKSCGVEIWEHDEKTGAMQRIWN